MWREHPVQERTSCGIVGITMSLLKGIFAFLTGFSPAFICLDIPGSVLLECSFYSREVLMQGAMEGTSLYSLLVAGYLNKRDFLFRNYHCLIVMKS